MACSDNAKRRKSALGLCFVRTEVGLGGKESECLGVVAVSQSTLEGCQCWPSTFRWLTSIIQLKVAPWEDTPSKDFSLLAETLA